MSILWEFHASHKLGPSRSITCKEKQCQAPDSWVILLHIEVHHKGLGWYLAAQKVLHVTWRTMM